MPLLSFALLFLALLHSPSAHAVRMDFTFAGTVRKDGSAPTQSGLSLRSNITFFPKGSKLSLSPMFVADFPGTFTAPDLIGAFGIRNGSKTFMEIGGGARWSPLWGLNFGIIAIFGIELNPKFALCFPLIYRGGAAGGLTYAPYIGFYF